MTALQSPPQGAAALEHNLRWLSAWWILRWSWFGEAVWVIYLIDVRGHHRLTIDPSAANERAIHVYSKLGFRPVGIQRLYERGPDGTFHDGLFMDLLADDLR